MSLSAWQQLLFDRAVTAFRSQRLGHAQLLQGEAHLGKLVLARALAKRLLCQKAGDAEVPCGVCTACQRFEQGSHGDFRQIGIELNEKTGKLKTAIGVDQIRDMSEWLALTAQLAGPRVVIIETAHRLNAQAANALLKTLEEPMPGRYLILVTDQPKALPATVRSRCQRIEMACPDTATALAWLKQNIADADAKALLAMASGNPGLALEWAGNGGSALYQEIRADLAACVKNQTGPAAITRKWLADERTDLRLLFAAQIAYGLARTWAAQAAEGVKTPQAVERLQEWIDGIN
ncbi:MAG: hypothetical protein RIS14_475, partial [Pseudomonadota bacterium]